jgi:hypothetical protein
MNIKNLFGSLSYQDAINIFSLLKSSDFNSLKNPNIERPTYYTENIIYRQNKVVKLIKTYYYRTLDDMDYIFKNLLESKSVLNSLIFNYNNFAKELNYLLKIYQEKYDDSEIINELEIIRILVLNYYCLNKICNYLNKYYNTNLKIVTTYLDEFTIQNRKLIDFVVNYYNKDNIDIGRLSKIFYTQLLNMN